MILFLQGTQIFTLYYFKMQRFNIHCRKWENKLRIRLFYSDIELWRTVFYLFFGERTYSLEIFLLKYLKRSNCRSVIQNILLEFGWYLAWAPLQPSNDISFYF